MANAIPPSQETLREALDLSEGLLQNIELSEYPLTNIALKTSRLARLLNESEMQTIMQYEAGGYPTTGKGVPRDVWELAVHAGRKFEEKGAGSSEIKEYIFQESIEELEKQVDLGEVALQAANDPDVSVTSANPHQHVINPMGNMYERRLIRADLTKALKRLSSRRGFIHSYILRKNSELKYSGIADDIFSRVRKRVDRAIGTHVPESVQKLIAVHENLRSDNAEDWSNAVHSCRRILQDLADSIYPPRDDIDKEIDGETRVIKLGQENYINRLVAFIEENSASIRYSEIVGSHLRFVGDRLDSVFKAAQKGSHGTIVSPEEADRYVIYTYLIVGDILALLEPASSSGARES